MLVISQKVKFLINKNKRLFLKKYKNNKIIFIKDK